MSPCPTVSPCPCMSPCPTGSPCLCMSPRPFTSLCPYVTLCPNRPPHLNVSSRPCPSPHYVSSLLACHPVPLCRFALTSCPSYISSGTPTPSGPPSTAVPVHKGPESPLNPSIVLSTPPPPSLLHIPPFPPPSPLPHWGCALREEDKHWDYTGQLCLWEPIPSLIN